MNKRVYNYNKLKRYKRNLKTQNYNGSITETTQYYFYICVLETEVREDR